MSRQLSGGASQLRVMTYNVLWEAFDVNRQTQCKSPSGVNRCVRMMAYFIAYFLPDILCLQEIREDVQWPQLHAALLHYLPSFNTMFAWSSTRQGEAGMMTVYSKRKFEVLQHVTGDFLGSQNAVASGRPYQALLFKCKVRQSPTLLVVNVHMPHNNELLPETAAACFKKVQELARRTELKYNHFILAGDFNRNPLRTIPKLGLKLLTSPDSDLLTCFNQRQQTFSLAYDHIFSTLGDKRLYDTLPPEAVDVLLDKSNSRDIKPVMSDHLPVRATFALPLHDWESSVPWSPPDPPLLADAATRDELLFVIHTTNVPPEQLESVRPETWTELRIPPSAGNGVYTSLVTKSNFDLTYLYDCNETDTSYIFVLPIDVLQVNNYHINLTRQYGNMNAITTYMPWELTAAVKHIKHQSLYAQTDEEFVAAHQAQLAKATKPDASRLAPFIMFPFNEVVFSRAIQLVPGCFRVYVKQPSPGKLCLLKDVGVPRTQVYQPRSGCQFFRPNPDPNQVMPCFAPSDRMLWNGAKSHFYRGVKDAKEVQDLHELHQDTILNACVDPLLSSMYWDLNNKGLEDFFFQQILPQYLRNNPKPLKLNEYAEWEEFKQSLMYKTLQQGGLYQPKMRTFLERQAMIPANSTWQQRLQLELTLLNKRTREERTRESDLRRLQQQVSPSTLARAQTRAALLREAGKTFAPMGFESQAAERQFYVEELRRLRAQEQSTGYAVQGGYYGVGLANTT